MRSKCIIYIYLYQKRYRTLSYIHNANKRHIHFLRNYFKLFSLKNANHSNKNKVRNTVQAFGERTSVTIFKWFCNIADCSFKSPDVKICSWYNLFTHMKNHFVTICKEFMMQQLQTHPVPYPISSELGT
jgi:hypothetical protein